MKEWKIGFQRYFPYLVGGFWEVVVGVVSFIGGVIADKLFLGKRLDNLFNPVSDRAIINDLKEYEECMARFEKEQNSEGEWTPTDSAEDMKLIYTMLDFEDKYDDWLSIDPATPPAKRAKMRRRKQSSP